MNQVDVIIGLQWGDEGKGKMIDVLCENYDIVARYQGGPNAGHTIIFDGKKIVLHTLPSGFCRPHCLNVIGNGVVINPTILKKEVEHLATTLNKPQSDIAKRLVISNKASLILPTHPLLDQFQEEAKGTAKIGSTLKGIGPCYMDKTARNGLLVGDIFDTHFEERLRFATAHHISIMNQKYRPDSLEEWLQAIEWLKTLKIESTELLINAALNDNKKILAEGAQGAMLDINFGTYPYVTSSITTTSGVCQGLGIAPQKIGKVFGVFKAYTTRVGEGPFPSELNDATGILLREKGFEFGSTTGRPRRCGWLDLPLLNYAIMINGVTDLMLMKVDVLADLPHVHIASHYTMNEQIFTTACTDKLFLMQTEIGYEIFPSWKGIFEEYRNETNFKNYIRFIEQKTKLPISYISYGPDRDQVSIE